MIEKASQIFGALIALGTVTVVLSSRETARVITSTFTGFTGALKAAMGRG